MKKYIILFLNALLFVACGGDKKEQTAKAETPTDNTVTLTEAQIKNAGIVTGQPAMQEVNGTLQLQGSVTVPPESMVSVSFPLGGYIKSTKILQGMHVTKGQVLAVIEDMQFIQLQHDYLTAKEKYELASMEYNRQKELNAKKASSDKLFEQTSAEKETQHIYMASLEQKLSMIGINPKKLHASNISKTVSVISPINGLVSKVNINVGKYIAPTDMLFEVINLNDIVLNLNVFEKDVQSLSIGQKIVCYANGNKQKVYNAKIAYINHSLNQDRAAEVICRFDTYNKVLLPGMFINADVEVANKKALTVPEEAVVRWQDNFYVFVVSATGTFKITKVDAGTLDNGKRQFNSQSITTSTKVVVKNAYTLLMKMKNSGEGE